jgi:hypothetical protein
MRNRTKFRTFLYQHFRKRWSFIKNVSIQPVEQIIYDSDASASFKVKFRHLAELKWIKSLQTPFLLGLNDSIFQQNKISKNPNIDIFSILNVRKRKSRSHERRRNGNIKRKLPSLSPT